MRENKVNTADWKQLAAERLVRHTRSFIQIEYWFIFNFLSVVVVFEIFFFIFIFLSRFNTCGNINCVSADWSRGYMQKPWKSIYMQDLRSSAGLNAFTKRDCILALHIVAMYVVAVIFFLLFCFLIDMKHS